MSHATILFPHQLIAPTHALFNDKRRPVFLIEEPLFLNEFPTHRSKLLFHRLTLTSYAHELRDAGVTVHYGDVQTLPTTEALCAHIAGHGITTLHYCDPTDQWLSQRLTRWARQHHLTLVAYESPLFLLPSDEATTRYTKSRRKMATFYRQLRLDRNLLLTPTGEPEGGQFSFDTENRLRLPSSLPLPPEPQPYDHPDLGDGKAWLATLAGEHYGEAAVWLPTDRRGARQFLEQFLHERLAQFGPYEDALSTRGVRLFHSALSPILNCGLLTPQEVLSATLAHHARHPIPLPSLEGFVRQILGWREFLRAAYITDGSTMRTKNVFQHRAPLPPGSWDGSTGLAPVDHAIKTALTYGYTHHIDRLMVLGNYFLLMQTDPDQVYRWFMAMYLDAYDWVMVPNVYGMSQFADGGLFATKPYIAGSNYIKKMSDYSGGPWEYDLTALYWHFVTTHPTLFEHNPRSRMLLRLWEKLPATRREALQKRAKHLLKGREYSRDPLRK
jgi:deoxyribodipyrimidine photolyase-related protein